jgi:hypothetical protein
MYDIETYYSQEMTHEQLLVQSGNRLDYVQVVNGDKYWYREKCTESVLHREDGPAIEYADGSKAWYEFGKLHRENNEPAIECIDGHKEWWIRGSFRWVI